MNMDSQPVGALDTPFQELIQLLGLHERTADVMRDAISNETWPYKTPRELLDAGHDAWLVICSLPNFGTLAANDLLDRVHAVVQPELQPVVESVDRQNVLGMGTSLSRFFEQPGISARLQHLYLSAVDSGQWPFETVGELLEAGHSARSRLLKLQNCGKKTVDELFAMLDQARATGFNTASASFCEGAAEIPLSVLLDSSLVSTRIRNVYTDAVEDGDWPYETVGDLLRAGESAHRTLSKIKNLGRKSIQELLRLAEKCVSEGLDMPKPEVKKSPEPIVEKRLLPKLAELEARFPGIFDPLISAYRDESAKDAFGILALEKVIRTLSAKDYRIARIISYRYEGFTLKDIGEEFDITRERIRQIVLQYKQYIVDKGSREWAINEVSKVIRKLEAPGVLPTNNELDRHHPNLARALAKHFLSEENSHLSKKDRIAIAGELGLKPQKTDYPRWTQEKVIQKVQEVARQIGKPGLMPKQKDMEALGEFGLRGIIQRLGGQRKVAELAGLKPQGQLTGEDGGRVYWTKERMRNFLYDVAEKEGHPGVMPTQDECIQYAGESRSGIISILCRLHTKKEPNLTWWEVARKYGLKYEKRTLKITAPFIKAFLKSLGEALYTLTPAEIYVLFEQQGIVGDTATSEGYRTYDKILESVQSGYLPKKELEQWLGDESSELIEALLDTENKTVEEALKKADRPYRKTSHRTKQENPDDEVYREDIEATLPTIAAQEALSSLDKAVEILEVSSSDKESIQFLIAKAADKLWRRCFADEVAALEEAKSFVGGEYATSVRDRFLQDYKRSKQLPLPTGYSFRDNKGIPREPKLMQKMIAYRVQQEGRVLNLSGTGTGKTLSGVLASRTIGADVTIIACPNATVDGWECAILNAFPESVVVTKNWSPRWDCVKAPKYLVINHEMFQNRNTAVIKRFIEHYPIDFVIVDELHQVKQRNSNPEKESQRRHLVSAVITDLPDGRPEPCVLGMTATPIINNLQEGKSLIELISSRVHDEIGNEATVHNCMKVFQQFTTMGFRMMPIHQQSRVPQIKPVDCSRWLPALFSLGIRPHPQKVEEILVKARMSAIKDMLRPKTVVFTEYVTGIVPFLRKEIEATGYSTGTYTGSEKEATDLDFDSSLHQFLKGKTDVLIASIKTLGTGIDGLQYICNNIIFATLPWTSTDYEQAIGRFDREGFAFERLDIHVPKTYAVLPNGNEWSWCDSRLKRLENKRDLAKAAVDGEIPDASSQLTPQKASNYLMNWLRRLDEHGVNEIEREVIRVPLDETIPSEVERRHRSYGDLSTIHARWNNTHSAKTHKRLVKNPEEWSYYHTRLLEAEKEWQVLPREHAAERLRCNLPKGSRVADFGCGRASLAENIEDIHRVISFDHIAINNDVIECDMAETPLLDAELDAAVFSLSLMGSNMKDYLMEAWRALKPGGQLLIYHPAKGNDRVRFVDGLSKIGFAVTRNGQLYKWHWIWAIKEGKQEDVNTSLSF